MDWNDVGISIHSIANQIKANNKGYDSIYGVPRGGLIPAVMLSHRLGLPLATRSRAKSGEGNVLVVDDIADTGRTVSFYRHRDVAVLVLRYNS